MPEASIEVGSVGRGRHFRRLKLRRNHPKRRRPRKRPTHRPKK